MKKPALIVLSLSLLSNAYAKPCRLSGQVLGAQGLPAAGAVVYLTGTQSEDVAIADAKGSYVFLGLEKGAYALQAWDAGRCSTSQALSVAGSDLYRDIDASVSNRQVPVTIKATRTDGGTGATRVLHLMADYADPAKTKLMDDPSVRSVLRTLEPGAYEVMMTRPGSAYLGTLFILAGQGGRPAQIVEAQGQEVAVAEYVEATAQAPQLLAQASVRLP